VICLAFAPVITLSVLKKRMNPAPFLVALALASNIGAAATPIGNPQNILIANEARLHFGPYLLWCLPPVLLSLLVAFGVCAFLAPGDFRNSLEVPRYPENFPAFDRYETWKGLVVLALVFALFFTALPRSLVMVSGAGFLLVSRRIQSADLLAKVDWSILTLFASLFIVVGGLEATGLPSRFLQSLTGRGFDLHNPYLLATVTAVLSNLMSNAATVMLFSRTLDLSDPVLGYVLCLANSLAGNLLLIGSIANLIAVEQGAALGVKVSFKDFAKYGIPVTTLSLGLLMLWIWLRT
jgi:Na+/H+ antiporter NhaD/arsenite permease-like protein